MICFNYFRALCVLSLVYLLTACSGGGGTSQAQSSNADLLPAIATVSALSQHYVKVSFNKAADPSADGNILNYNIKISASKQSVPVTAATPSPDHTYVILEIAPTSDQLQQMAGGTLEFDLAGINDTPIIFSASSTPDPSITGIAAVTDTSVVITFSEAVSDNVADIANYSITTSDGQALAIVAASIGNFGDSVMLTTASQQDVTYALKLTNITSKVSGLPIYPSGGGKTFLGMSLKTATSVAPQVVAAISTDNTHVTVTYNKPMSANAEDAANYSIVQVNVNPESGMLGVVQAQFINAEHSAVQLTTRSQNEVTYQVSAVNVSDNYGKQIGQVTGTNVLLAANSAQFAGTPPSANDLVDTDGDGLYDNEEELGYTVFIEMANGEVVARQVTSDPDKADTDGDGVSDADEKLYGTNPRATDTDADGLNDNLELNTIFSNPYAQDTDLDGLQDGLEYFALHTSPLLADTDGDKLDDNTELFQLNRNPLVADLPDFQISVGDVRLQIDERYTYTDETGATVSQESSTSATLAQSNSTSFNRSDTSVTQGTFAVDAGFEVGNARAFGSEADTPAGKAVVNFHGEVTHGETTQIDHGSAAEAQQAYENSLNKGKQFSTTSTVTREVVGARIDADVSIENIGNVPFSLSNIEITVLAPSPIDSSKYLPVATLIANSQLITGTPLVVNLGSFNNQHGPFVFSNTEIYPNLVESLMRNPRGLIFKVANYDVTDELGRNFAFSNQVARDRTAGIALDLGDEASAENHYVATSGALDDKGYAGGNGTAYVGGFNADGSAKGLPLDYILQARLGMKRHDTTKDTIVPGPNRVLDSTPAGDDVIVNGVITAGINGWLETAPASDDYITNPTAQDGIVAGLNQTADSIAQGDDIQLVPVGTTGLSVGTVVIGAGDNGVLDTPALGDDKPDFVTGYETSRTCSATSPRAGHICRVASDCSSASSSTPGSCTGPQRLVRVNSLRNGDYNRAWFVLTSASVPTAADFGQISVKPGQNVTLAFLQDLDRDGLFAREEFLAGSIDSSADQLDNSQFGINFDINSPPPCSAPLSGTACDGIPDSRDSDRDGLGDYAEVRVGWKVAADGGVLHQIYSSPALRDSDGDGLLDPEERDLRGYCAANDPRIDGLCAFQLQLPVTQDKAIGIVAGPNGTADSVAGDINGDGIVDASDVDANGNPSDDMDLLGSGARTGLGYGTPVVGPGLNGKIETALRGDDVYESMNSVPPATDPTQADTDIDGVSDYTELKGYDVGLAIIDGGNGIADTTTNGDDVQKVLYGNPVTPGGIVILPGDNGVIDSYASPDDILRPAHTVTTDPLRRDTDNDTNTDGLEIALGSDPTVADGADFRDSDHDGLTDNEESSLGWVVTVNGTSYTVKSSPSLPDTDGDGLPDFIERDLRTDPNKVDTDGDGISDYDEVQDFERFVRLMANYPNVVIDGSGSARYGTDPLKQDTDGDSLSDYQELIDGFYLTLPGDTAPRLIHTSPVLADTDGDKLTDQEEVLTYKTDPTNNDTDGDGRTDGAEITVGSNPLVPDRSVTVRYSIMQLKGNVTNLGWDFYVQMPNQTSPGYLVSTAADNIGYPITNSAYCTYITPGNLSTLYYASQAQATITMHQGDYFVLSGTVYDFENCSVSPRIMNCIANFSKSFTYDDVATGSTGTMSTTPIYGTCTQDITYDIVVN